MSRANYLLQEVATYLEQRLKATLVAQDHVATGDLYNSIEAVVQETVKGWKIVGSNLFYGNIQDTGLKPGIYVPIKALIDWIRAKRINLQGKKELSVAFAIRAAIYKKGTPTDGDDKKKRWISRTLEEEEQEIKKRIQKAMALEVELMVENMVGRF